MDLLDQVKNLFGNFNLAAMGEGLLVILVVFLIALLVGGFIFVYYFRKSKKVQFKNKIPIFKDISGKRVRVGIDDAKELFVPDSNISLFFLKSKKIYLPRPTRMMSKDEFWYSISVNGEWVNFDLSVDPDKNTLAQANYDHRDTRYAYTNLTDIIKKNYSDKAVKWWKEYSHIISFILIAFVTILGIWILLTRIGTLLEDVGSLMGRVETLIETSCAGQNINSGLAKA